MLDNIALTNYCKRMFSDETHFHLNGKINIHNCRYWSTNNYLWVSEKPLHSPRITVWAAIGEGGLIGPVFIDQNVTGDNYLIYWNQIFGQHLSTCHFLMRWYSCRMELHHIGQERQWLSDNLPNRWIGRGSDTDGNMKWPARSYSLRFFPVAIYKKYSLYY